jgi:hypothetical protein
MSAEAPIVLVLVLDPAEWSDAVTEWWSDGGMTYFRIAFALRVGVSDGTPRARIEDGDE